MPVPQAEVIESGSRCCIAGNRIIQFALRYAFHRPVPNTDCDVLVVVRVDPSRGVFERMLFRQRARIERRAVNCERLCLT